MMEELKEIFGDSGIPQVRGIAQFEITACAQSGRDRICRRVTSRRQVELSGPPCREQVEAMAVGGEMGSLVHLHPVEFGRQVEKFTTTEAGLREILAGRSQRFQQEIEEAGRLGEEQAEETWLSDQVPVVSP